MGLVWQKLFVRHADEIFYLCILAFVILIASALLGALNRAQHRWLPPLNLGDARSAVIPEALPLP